MKDLDKFLYKFKEEEKSVPNSFSNKIQNFSPKTKESWYFNMKLNKFKNAIVIALSLLLGSGVVFAATKTYESIWKEPKAYKLNHEISEEERKKCISEEEAEKIGNDYLKKIGFEEETIKKFSITKKFF